MPFGACVTGARRTTSAGVKVTAWVVSAICFILAHWTLPPVISGAPLVTTSSPGTSQRQSCWANCQPPIANREPPMTLNCHLQCRQQPAMKVLAKSLLAGIVGASLFFCFFMMAVIPTLAVLTRVTTDPLDARSVVLTPTGLFQRVGLPLAALAFVVCFALGMRRFRDAPSATLPAVSAKSRAAARCGQPQPAGAESK